VIKFRCRDCAQKLGVNDEGVGRGFHCPICGAGLIVPPLSDEEFRHDAEVVAAPLVPVKQNPGLMRTELWPQLAQCLSNWVTQTLFFQRRQLLEAQALATARVEMLEERLVQLHRQIQQRVAGYESRIAELETRLAEAERENRQLQAEAKCVPFPRPAAERDSSRARLFVGA